MIKQASVVVIVLTTIIMMSSCSEERPSEESLKHAFKKVMRVELEDGKRRWDWEFREEGDEFFLHEPRRKDDHHIIIVGVEIKKYDDEMKPYKGIVRLEWYFNGKLTRDATYANTSRFHAGENGALWGKRSKEWEFYAPGELDMRKVLGQ